MLDTPAPTAGHVHWTKEVQRRSYRMETARNRGASAEELTRLQEAVDEADRMRRGDAT